MTREELRDYVDEQRTLDNIPYHVYSALIDGIDTLDQESVYFPPCVNCNTKMNEIREAYDKLKNQALEQEPCEGAVNRQVVLDMLEDINAETDGVGFYYEHYVEYIKNLPPVQPKIKTGHWIKYDKEYFTAEKLTPVIHSIRECSECHTRIADFCGEMKYCPNCGAKMESEG